MISRSLANKVKSKKLFKFLPGNWLTPSKFFFSIFPLKGLRVYKNEKQVVDTVVQESIVQNNDENKLEDVFGKERLPNSYNTLPLAKDETYRKPNNNEDDYGDDDWW